MILDVMLAEEDEQPILDHGRRLDHSQRHGNLTPYNGYAPYVPIEGAPSAWRRLRPVLAVLVGVVSLVLAILVFRSNQRTEPATAYISPSQTTDVSAAQAPQTASSQAAARESDQRRAAQTGDQEDSSQHVDEYTRPAAPRVFERAQRERQPSTADNDNIVIAKTLRQPPRRRDHPVAPRPHASAVRAAEKPATTRPRTTRIDLITDEEFDRDIADLADEGQLLAAVDPPVLPAPAGPAVGEAEPRPVSPPATGSQIATAATAVGDAPDRRASTLSTAQPMAPAARQPSTPARPQPTGPLRARVRFSDLQVHGSLTTSTIRRSIERHRGDFERCYERAAVTANRNDHRKVKASFELDLRGRSRNPQVSGARLPGLASCMIGVLQHVATNRAPDTGTVKTTVELDFTP